MKYVISALLALFAIGCNKPNSSASQNPENNPPQEKKSIDIKASFIKAANWLVGLQDENGAILKEVKTPKGVKKFPNLPYTCMTVYALLGAPNKIREKYSANIEKGLKLILSRQEGDGGWSNTKDDYRTYCTALAIMVLNAADRKKFSGQITKAQIVLHSLQVRSGIYEGGHGYGDKGFTQDGREKISDKATMDTTVFVARAMWESGYSDKEYWERLVKFTQKHQNVSENVDPEWAKLLAKFDLKPGNDGSGNYTLDIEYNKNEDRIDKDRKTLIGYGSMTYAILETYLYAGLTKEDWRVKSAVEWLRGNYTVDFHPGFPEDSGIPDAKKRRYQGLYFYYMMMARCMDAYVESPFKTRDGKLHDWPRELGEKLVSLQKENGSWVNENAKWWEDDSALVTAYVLMIYDIIFKHLK